MDSLIVFFQAEDGIRAGHVTGVQTCALPIYRRLVQCGLGAASVRLVLALRGHGRIGPVHRDRGTVGGDHGQLHPAARGDAGAVAQGLGGVRGPVETDDDAQVPRSGVEGDGVVIGLTIDAHGAASAWPATAAWMTPRPRVRPRRLGPYSGPRRRPRRQDGVIIPDSRSTQTRAAS